MFFFIIPAVAEESEATEAQALDYYPGKPIPLTLLPRDRYGLVDWVKAVTDGILEPLASIDSSENKEQSSDTIIRIKAKSDFMPDAQFPHKPHTYWLKCETCHPQIFPAKKGGSPKMTMWDILRGEYCGRCHDRVAFPLRECYRCHFKKERTKNVRQMKPILRPVIINKPMKNKPIPLTLFPRDKYELIDWAEGVRQGILDPLASIDGSNKDEEIIDMLVQIKSKKKFMTDVIFPHSMHTYWLSCDICHPKIFPAKKGGSPEMTMWDILRGEYCGRCHDRVAFPLRECYRCHIKRKK